jgi:hypothetical protein
MGCCKSNSFSATIFKAVAANNTIPNYKVVGDFFYSVVSGAVPVLRCKLFVSNPFLDAGRSFF